MGGRADGRRKRSRIAERYAATWKGFGRQGFLEKDGNLAQSREGSIRTSLLISDSCAVECISRLDGNASPTCAR